MAETLGVVAMLMGAHGVTGDGTTGDVTDSAPAWWLHQIVLGDLVVGDTGFHGPPEVAGPVEVEIGYNVVESLRGRGIATSVCRLLLAQAWRDGADAVRAEADEGNEASVRVLLRSGFTELGDRRYRVQRPAGASR
jgi:RimJ/RimL family protein N-acetyltransferase